MFDQFNQHEVTEYESPSTVPGTKNDLWHRAISQLLCSYIVKVLEHGVNLFYIWGGNSCLLVIVN